MQQFKEGEVTKPGTAPTLKEGTPARFMLRYLTILSPVVLRNQREKLPETAKIGGGAPSTIREVNFMEYE